MTQKRARQFLLPLIPLAVFLLLWEYASAQGIINAALFSAPSRILERLVLLLDVNDLANSALLEHVYATLYRLATAAVIGTIVGITIGVLMGVSRVAFALLDPIITLVMPIPGIAMAPLFIVWFGFGDPTIIRLGVIAMIFPLIYNTSAGIRSIDKSLIRAAQTMGIGPVGAVFQVYLPFAASYMLLGLKLGLARSWRTVIAVEFVAASNNGIGYMIWDGAEYLRSDIVYSGIVVLVIIYMLLDKVLINALENQTIRKWGVFST